MLLYIYLCDDQFFVQFRVRTLFEGRTCWPALTSNVCLRVRHQTNIIYRSVAMAFVISLTKFKMKNKKTVEDFFLLLMQTNVSNQCFQFSAFLSFLYLLSRFQCKIKSKSQFVQYDFFFLYKLNLLDFQSPTF